MIAKRVGILGATGTVGQRFITLLERHPWFTITALAASARSAGKQYQEAIAGRWKMPTALPQSIASMPIFDVADLKEISQKVDFVFCAVDLPKDDVQRLENSYAEAGIPVVSCNSAHRWSSDVPMLIPEINSAHAKLIEIQRQNRGWKGFIAVKPNCSLQSYLPAIAALMEFQPTEVVVTTMQAISGAGKTLAEVPELLDNVIPLPGEEEKSEREPLKILGVFENSEIKLSNIKISAHCHRVPTEEGHMAVVSIKFAKKPSSDQIMAAWTSWQPEPQRLELPSAPHPCIQYLIETDRPQVRLDRDWNHGMGFSVGRLRPCPVLDYRFSTLSHNTVRGAAGGAVLTAELLYKQGYL